MSKIKLTKLSLRYTGRFLAALIIFSLLFSGLSQAASKRLLKIHFIDVGQADCILIQAPNGKNMLVDAGNNEDVPLIASYLNKQGIKTLNVIIGTHPHEDHIGGMDAIIKQFSVGKIYLPKVTTTTKTFKDLLLAVKSKGLKINTARSGSEIMFDPTINIQVLAPNRNKYKELNNYSVVFKLAYGKRSFLFTGDAEDVSESEMVEKGYNLKADLLKVGHHGSSNSTTAQFLAAVAPQHAVISVGKDNEYRHPHPESLSRLKKAKVKVYRTDLMGTIIFISDGKTLKLSKS